MTQPTADLAVVGGGVIGLGIAWRCRQRGLSVTVIDPGTEEGAWHTAAGMLAPVTELHYGEDALLRLGVASAAAYPAFVAELEEATGIDVGYRRTGTISVAWDGADLAALRDLQAFQVSLGLDATLLTGREARTFVPALAPGLPGALLAAGDHSIDNRLLHKALLSAAGPVRPGRAVRVSAHEVELDDGTHLSAGAVVLATGAWSRQLRADVPVRPVKGQTIRLRTDPGLLAGNLRGSVKGTPIYLVPRLDGTVVVGASSEEAGFDQRPRAGAIYELLRDAQSVLPELSEAELIEVSTGLRPGTADNAPLLGAAADGVILATGHYRNGILLTPITADGIAALVTDAALPSAFEPFRPDRFTAGVTA